jgi:hypothetical protein
MASLFQGGLCYDGQESPRKYLIGFSHRCITIMAKFLGDDTLESNQWWEADSHLQRNIRLDSNQFEGADSYLQRNNPLESNQFGGGYRL